MQIILFEELKVLVNNNDWDYLCKNRFYTNNPTDEMIQSEFITGTGITPNKRKLWSEANERFADYIQDLREIQNLDINNMARKILTDEEK